MSARSTLALVATLAVAAIIPASALATQSDAAATSAYIEANYRFVQATATRIVPIESALRGLALARQVQGQCPLAVARRPQDADSEQLSDEVIGAMVLTGGRLILPAVRQFVSAASRLTWSDRSLTVAVRAYVAKIKRLETLTVPKLCTDVQSWAASAFQTLPASTVSFDAKFLPNWIAVGELPTALVPYEMAAERPLVRRSEHLEVELAELEAREVETYAQILDELVLQQ